MMLPFKDLMVKHGISVRGVVQVGSHIGQETDDFRSAGALRIALIEPCREPFGVLTSKYASDASVKLFNVACGESNEDGRIFVSPQNEGMSNSLLEPKQHLEDFADIKFPGWKEDIKIRRLDDMEIDFEDHNVLVMDVQGFEDRVLKGAPNALRYVDAVYTEINNVEMYAGNALVSDLDKLLSDFQRVETKWADEKQHWGDALYVRRKPAKFPSKIVEITVNPPQPHSNELRKAKGISLRLFMPTAVCSPDQKMLDNVFIVFGNEDNPDERTKIRYEHIISGLLAGHEFYISEFSVSSVYEINAINYRTKTGIFETHTLEALELKSEVAESSKEKEASSPKLTRVVFDAPKVINHNSGLEFDFDFVERDTQKDVNMDPDLQMGVHPIRITFKLPVSNRRK